MRKVQVNFSDRMNSVTEEIKELALDLEAYASETELDERELARIEERLSEIVTLKRKYGPTIESALSNLENAKERLDKLENFEVFKNKLHDKLKQLKADYDLLASKLSKKRKSVAERFSKETKAKLNGLGFLKADISVSFLPDKPSSTGTDKIEIMFTANPGEEKQPLRKVASSGEISRVMLAIKTVLTSADNTPVLIFDEIDSNIGGEVAGRVGEELQNLGKKHHVLCISHQAHVAAFADSHYSVSKMVTEDSRTFTKISKLDDCERTSEIARMLGGGKAAHEHARKIVQVKS